jgi:HK97 family phage prohead protease
MKNKIQFRTFSGAVVRSEDDKEDKEGRKFTFVASDSTRDASGTVLNQEGWQLDRYNANGIVGYQHKVYGGLGDKDDPDNIIGKGRAYVKDGKLMVDVELEPEGDNPLADKVCRKLRFGSLNAVSVGFVPVGRSKWGEGDEAADGGTPTLYFAGQELLEISVVNIPSNPNALRKELEGDEDEDQKELDKQEEQEEQEEGKALVPEEEKHEEGGDEDPEEQKALDEDEEEEEEEEPSASDDNEEIERSLTIAEATLLYL